MGHRETTRLQRAPDSRLRLRAKGIVAGTGGDVLAAGVIARVNGVELQRDLDALFSTATLR